MSTTTTAQLTVAQARELRHRADAASQELKTLRLGGAEGTSQYRALVEIRDTLLSTLRSWEEERARAESERHRQELARRKEVEAAKEKKDKELQAAHAFLEDRLVGIASMERSDLEEEAGALGISSATLLRAAREAGVKSARRYGSGGKLAGPEIWSRAFYAGFGGIKRV